MKFTVRYWSSLLPAPACWVDYSVHPASKLGLHNALLAVHDRCEILAAHGGQFECAVFVSEGERVEKLTPAAADSLFAALPHGEVKWLDIRAGLPPSPELVSAPPAATEPLRQSEQLPLFVHVHTAYDDLDQVRHAIDLDI